MSVDFKVETELETDGRWLAEVVELPGMLARLAKHSGLRPEDL